MRIIAKKVIIRQLTGRSKAIVCIDAPHGGSDTGQYDGTNYEKTQMLSLADSVKNELESAGVTVVMTRTTDTSVDYTKRIEICNNAKQRHLCHFIGILLISQEAVGE